MGCALVDAVVLSMGLDDRSGDTSETFEEVTCDEAAKAAWPEGSGAA